MRALYSSHIACFQLGSRRAWKGDLGIKEEVVTCKFYLGLAFTILTLERVTIGCCEVGGGGGGGVGGGVGVVCSDSVDRGVGGVVCGVVCGFVYVSFSSALMCVVADGQKMFQTTVRSESLKTEVKDVHNGSYPQQKEAFATVLTLNHTGFSGVLSTRFTITKRQASSFSYLMPYNDVTSSMKMEQRTVTSVSFSMLFSWYMMLRLKLAVEPEKSNRLSDDADASSVSIQQPPLSLQAYYSLAGWKDFPDSVILIYPPVVSE
ncbi:hypothetical protein Tco_0026573 [Tanacetum coccineum]